MSRIIQTTVYTFEELDTQAKERARAWFREGNEADPDFAESVLKDFVSIAGFCGWELSTHPVQIHGGGTRQEADVYYSGFSSQGDGACFEGYFKAGQVAADNLNAHAPVDSELHRIVAVFAEFAKLYPEASASASHRGRYYHSNSVTFDIELGNDPIENPNEAYDKMQSERFEETSRDLMNWLYAALEREYNYQQLDEVVDETILANGYEFLITGERA